MHSWPACWSKKAHWCCQWMQINANEYNLQRQNLPKPGSLCCVLWVCCPCAPALGGRPTLPSRESCDTERATPPRFGLCSRLHVQNMFNSIHVEVYWWSQDAKEQAGYSYREYLKHCVRACTTNRCKSIKVQPVRLTGCAAKISTNRHESFSDTPALRQSPRRLRSCSPGTGWNERLLWHHLHRNNFHVTSWTNLTVDDEGSFSIGFLNAFSKVSIGFPKLSTNDIWSFLDLALHQVTLPHRIPTSRACRTETQSYEPLTSSWALALEDESEKPAANSSSETSAFQMHCPLTSEVTAVIHHHDFGSCHQGHHVNRCPYLWSPQSSSC